MTISGGRTVRNRKLSERRIEQRKRQRASQGREPFVANASGTYPVARPPQEPRTTQEVTLSDRRRPGRGFGGVPHSGAESTTAEAPTSGRITMRSDLGHATGELLFEVLCKLVVVVVFPVQLAFLLLRPRELFRRLGEAPGRLRSTARRLRLQTRDPETAAGRMWDSVRLSAHFVREEMADMQDGFPSLDDVARSGMGAVSRGGRHVSGRISSRLSSSSEEVYERLQHSAALGLVAGVVVVGLFVAGYQGLENLKQSERLTIQGIEVQGLDRVDRGELLSELRVGEGDNLLELQTGVLSARAAALPWVDSLSLRRDLRGQQLELAVVEHKPVMLLAGSPIRLLNESGEAFKPLEAEDPVDLPFLSLVDGADQDQPEMLREAAHGAVQILHALASGTALREVDVSEIRFEGDAGYVIVTRTGMPVRLGREDFAVRLGRLERAARSGSLPLHALASVDLGLRDRLVAVPRAARSARRAVRKRVSSQPMAPEQRARVLELQGTPREKAADWGHASQ